MPIFHFGIANVCQFYRKMPFYRYLLTFNNKAFPFPKSTHYYSPKEWPPAGWHNFSLAWVPTFFTLFFINYWHSLFFGSKNPVLWDSLGHHSSLFLYHVIIICSTYVDFMTFHYSTSPPTPSPCKRQGASYNHYCHTELASAPYPFLVYRS